MPLVTKQPNSPGYIFVSTFTDLVDRSVIYQLNATVSGPEYPRYIGISTIIPTAKLHINGDTGLNQFRLEKSFTPSGLNDNSGYAGNIAWDNTGLYLRTSTKWIPVGASITLTTTGNNGSSTFISGVLNVPTYTLAGLGGINYNDLSATSPIFFNNTTGDFSSQAATYSNEGYVTIGSQIFGGIKTFQITDPSTVGSNTVYIKNLGTGGVGDFSETGLQFESSVGSTTNYVTGRIYSKYDGIGVGDARLTIQSLSGLGALIDTISVKAGFVGMSTNNPIARLHIIGSGNTSATESFKIDNTSLTPLINIRDDGFIGMGVVPTLTPFEVKHETVTTGGRLFRITDAVGYGVLGATNTAIGITAFGIQSDFISSLNFSLDFGTTDEMVIRTIAGGTSNIESRNVMRFRGVASNLTFTTVTGPATRNWGFDDELASPIAPTARIHISGNGVASDYGLKVQSATSGGTLNFQVRNSGVLSAPATSAATTYANNAAAIVGGLVAGDFYLVTGTDPRQIAMVF